MLDNNSKRNKSTEKNMKRWIKEIVKKKEEQAQKWWFKTFFFYPNNFFFFFENFIFPKWLLMEKLYSLWFLILISSFDLPILTLFWIRCCCCWLKIRSRSQPLSRELWFKKQKQKGFQKQNLSSPFIYLFIDSLSFYSRFYFLFENQLFL